MALNNFPETRADSFLRMIRRSSRGRLKVFLGYGAGVGKTYRMLQEGHSLKSERIEEIICGNSLLLLKQHELFAENGEKAIKAAKEKEEQEKKKDKEKDKEKKDGDKKKEDNKEKDKDNE